MPVFKPAYLIHGDDHGRLGERRTRLRSLAERESGASGVDVLEGDGATPDGVAAAIATMTFALGRRFVIVDGVQTWKEADVAPVAAALAHMDVTATTVAFFAREEGRYKAPKALHEAVKAVGGVIDSEPVVKPRELPRWVLARAAELGIRLDPSGARALVNLVGERQQRLLRELEKLALEHEPGATLGAEEVEAASAAAGERKVWTLADAVVAGDARVAVRALVELRAQGERLPGLVFGIARRLRDAHSVAVQLAAGRSPAQVKQSLRMPSFAADRLIADVRRREVADLRRALVALAELEEATRGGGTLTEDTAAVRAVIAGAG